MRTQSVDTHQDVERVQVELLRKATVARRAQLLRSLSGTMMYLSRRAIRRANPDATDAELAVIIVSLHYGQELAERLREYLARKQE